MARSSTSFGSLPKDSHAEISGRGGRVSGRQNAESGHLDEIRNDPKRLENLRPILLVRNKPDGIATVASKKYWKANPEKATNRSQLAMHQRWHVNEGKKPKKFCQFCDSAVNAA
jgi:hypothetical protein